MYLPYDIIYLVFRQATVATQIQMARAIPEMNRLLTRRRIRAYVRNCIEQSDHEGLQAICRLERGLGQYIKTSHLCGTRLPRKYKVNTPFTLAEILTTQVLYNHVQHMPASEGMKASCKDRILSYLWYIANNGKLPRDEFKPVKWLLSVWYAELEVSRLPSFRQALKKRFPEYWKTHHLREQWLKSMEY